MLAPWRIQVPRLLPERMFTNDRDSALLNHAQLFVLDEMAFVSDPADFWHSYAMPLAHIAMPLNYALCALGAAHRHFMLSGSGDLNGSKDDVLSSEIIAIEKYNAAITQIQDHACHDHQGIDAYVPLICCVVFICIEQLLGRYTECVRHLQAGCGLLRSSSNPRGSSAPRDLRNAVLKVFYQFSIDAAIFNGENVIGDLPFDYPRPDMGSRHEPFTSYDEASGMLQRVDVIYNISFVSPVVLPEPQPTEGCGFEIQENRAMNSAREAFHIWNARFKLLQQSDIPAPEPQPDDIFFSLEQSVWNLITETVTFEDALSIESCQTVLSQAESLALMYQSQKHPSFAPCGDLLPALTWICMSCEDRETRLRSVSVLRSLRRREGLWDSRELADECETMILTGIIPIVMAGILGIYGLVVSVLIANGLVQKVTLYTSIVQMGAGLSVGLARLAAGFAIGIVGDAGVRGTAQQPKLYVSMILILIFAEVLGLYGLIVALLINSRANIVEHKCV
ncbi:uncharacterized protein KD926_008997 [Aspergillus affinis]|uniref:uncharacterized protein n=1 Tax=Aspergillus affinis TaxID=1070780 RepID=UPI0022FE21ED|nr:uncharacterized protein KD926_008997 [Aspergillus affinis]KAI9039896.1 hypothetical protein KD926_008997 [Aspergillus affinis]